jgi:hypothetical protein
MLNHTRFVTALTHDCKDDDGFIVYESRAIARYLIKKYPNQGTTGLIPTDFKEEALFEQAASVEVSHFNSHAGPLVYEKVFKVYVYMHICEPPITERRVKGTLVVKRTRPRLTSTSKTWRRSSMYMTPSSASRNTSLATYVDGRAGI